MDKLESQDIHWAATQGDDRLLRDIVHNGTSINAKGKDGRNVLHSACNAGQSEVVDYLLSTFPHLDLHVDNDGNTSAHLAVLSGNVKTLKILIKRRARLDARNKEGLTALDYAIAYNLKSMQKVISNKYSVYTAEKISENNGMFRFIYVASFVLSLSYLGIVYFLQNYLQETCLVFKTFDYVMLAIVVGCAALPFCYEVIQKRVEQEDTHSILLWSSTLAMFCWLYQWFIHLHADNLNENAIYFTFADYASLICWIYICFLFSQGNRLFQQIQHTNFARQTEYVFDPKRYTLVALKWVAMFSFVYSSLYTIYSSYILNYLQNECYNLDTIEAHVLRAVPVMYYACVYAIPKTAVIIKNNTCTTRMKLIQLSMLLAQTLSYFWLTVHICRDLEDKFDLDWNSIFVIILYSYHVIYILLNSIYIPPRGR